MTLNYTVRLGVSRYVTLRTRPRTLPMLVGATAGWTLEVVPLLGFECGYAIYVTAFVLQEAIA